MGIRLAKLDDLEDLFELVNQKDSLRRKYSSQNKIKKSDHEEWFKNKLFSQKSRLWIIENDNKHKIGQIRIDLIEKIANIDIYLKKEHRGKGHAYRSLNEAIEIFSQSFNSIIYRAIINKNNSNSSNLFKKCGFKRINSHKEEWQYYNLEK